jgi:hypothetical protein
MLKRIRNAVTNVDNVAVAISTIALVGALYLLAVGINAWAQTSFARPILASCLITVIDLALFLVALALAPPISWLVARVIRWPLERLRGK